MIMRGLAWLFLLVAWAPVLYIFAVSGSTATTGLYIGLALGALAVIATISFGWHLGADRRRIVDVLLAGLIGTVALLSTYVALMLSQPDTPESDNAAGAGVAILGVPTLSLVVVLLGAGMMTHRLIARYRTRARYVGSVGVERTG